jgi:NADPH-dependent ferric siderophore reductase
VGSPEQAPTAPRVRRTPPPFRRLEVLRVEDRSPRLRRVTLAGPELEGFVLDEPAASVRLLLPSPGTDALVVPEWKGNEFLLPDGRRPVIRTLTPRRFDADARELDVEIVRHGDGLASQWADTAGPGAPAAVSGPGRGYAFDPDAPELLLAGDETAIPAIAQLLEALPPDTPTRVLVEVADPAAELPLPAVEGVTVSWHELPAGGDPGDALVGAVRAAPFGADARVWAAGEAAAVQRIRRHLFEERGVPRRHAVVRGYWKAGRAGTGDD